MAVPLLMLAGAALGAGASIYAGNKAADAQKDASQASIAEQQRQYNNSMMMYEPQRQLGYGAMSDIASLYGYSLPGYQNAQQLLGPGGAGGNWLMRDATMDGNVIKVGAHQSGGNDTMLSSQADMIGLGGLFGHGGGYNYAGGTIDPRTGTVTVTDSNPGAYNEALTNYLRTGEWSLDPRKTKYVSTVKDQIDKLRSSGWSWDTANNRGIGAGLNDPATNPMLAGRNESAPGNMSRFFASPDYNYRREEGMRGIQQSAAAGRGNQPGLFSGDTLRSLNYHNSGLASGEFGNYMNRLFNIAGMGQTATGQSAQAGQNYANQYSQAQQNMGDARASGVVTGVGGAMNAMNSGLNNYMLYQGGYFNRPDPMAGLSPVNIWQRRM